MGDIALAVRAARQILENFSATVRAWDCWFVILVGRVLFKILVGQIFIVPIGIVFAAVDLRRCHCFSGHKNRGGQKSRSISHLGKLGQDPWESLGHDFFVFKIKFFAGGLVAGVFSRERN